MLHLNLVVYCLSVFVKHYLLQTIHSHWALGWKFVIVLFIHFFLKIMPLIELYCKWHELYHVYTNLMSLWHSPETFYVRSGVDHWVQRSTLTQVHRVRFTAWILWLKNEKWSQVLNGTEHKTTLNNERGVQSNNHTENQTTPDAWVQAEV